jgi:hypothetical protein
MTSPAALLPEKRQHRVQAQVHRAHVVGKEPLELLQGELHKGLEERLASGMDEPSNASEALLQGADCGGNGIGIAAVAGKWEDPMACKALQRCTSPSAGSNGIAQEGKLARNRRPDTAAGAGDPENAPDRRAGHGYADCTVTLQYSAIPGSSSATKGDTFVNAQRSPCSKPRSG